MSGVKAVARAALERSGLIRPAFRLIEWLRSTRPSPAPGIEVEGPPLPPPYLLVLVAGAADPATFLASGRRQAEMLRAMAAAHGMEIATSRVLDFGCGCGRIARWLAAEVEDGGGRFHGSDINGKLIAWTKAHLPGAYSVNGLAPPAERADASLDLIYAHSVLTHLTEPVARAWLADFARVLRPGGLALLSFHDEGYMAAFGVDPKGGYVVQNPAIEGSNYMASFTTTPRFHALCEGLFEVLELRPSDVAAGDQAWAILRRPA